MVNTVLTFKMSHLESTLKVCVEGGGVPVMGEWHWGRGRGGEGGHANKLGRVSNCYLSKAQRQNGH